VFKFKEGSTEEIRRYNQDLRLSLLCDDAFHHKVCNYLISTTIRTQSQNQEGIAGFGEHCIIIDILQGALFEDSKSYGVKFSRYFNPISTNLLALVFTMVGPLAVLQYDHSLAGILIDRIFN
jgi:uncharacterized protein DUF6532